MFELEYASKDLIPTGFEYLYTERGGKFVLRSVAEIKTVEDVQAVQTALSHEREDHDATKAKLRAFNGLDPVETLARIDRIGELELAAKGKIDEAEINQIVESRITSRLAPVERERDALKTERDGLKEQVTSVQGELSQRDIKDVVLKAATAAKLTPGGIEDALHYASSLFTLDPTTKKVVTKEDVGVTPGVDPSVWLTEIQDKKSHWWPAAVGGGSIGNNATGGGGANPFSAENWNMTEQGNLLASNPARAEQMAKAAGTTVGGQRPELPK